MNDSRNIYGLTPPTIGMKDKWFIFDLDGTIADIEDRRILCTKENSKIDWGRFFDPENIKLDKPNMRVITMMNAFTDAGFKIAIFSGRSKRTKEATKEWLKKYNVPYNVLKMRPSNTAGSIQPNDRKLEFMPDEQLKQLWLDDLFPGEFKYLNLIAVFDDRDKVVKMWRNQGLRCCQVAEGDF